MGYVTQEKRSHDMSSNELSYQGYEKSTQSSGLDNKAKYVGLHSLQFNSAGISWFYDWMRIGNKQEPIDEMKYF